MRRAVPARPWHKARPELRVIACCYTAISGKFGKIKAGFDCDVVNLGILGSDQYLAHQIDARGFLSRTVVHPLQVSGGEYVRWRRLARSAWPARSLLRS